MWRIQFRHKEIAYSLRFSVCSVVKLFLFPPTRTRFQAWAAQGDRGRELDIKRLNDEGRELWNRKAAFWDELHGEFGNMFHRRLIEPTALRLLDLRAGEAVLDIGCGNGALARRLAAQGACVVAFDFSAEMIRLAKARSSADLPHIQY